MTTRTLSLPTTRRKVVKVVAVRKRAGTVENQDTIQMRVPIPRNNKAHLIKMASKMPKVEAIRNGRRLLRPSANLKSSRSMVKPTIGGALMMDVNVGISPALHPTTKKGPVNAVKVEANKEDEEELLADMSRWHQNQWLRPSTAIKFLSPSLFAMRWDKFRREGFIDIVVAVGSDFIRRTPL
jgi:hypothetical protein